MAFKVRDQVQLKTGGPLMVVEDVDGEQVATFWFDKNILHRDRFLASNLTLAGTKEPALA